MSDKEQNPFEMLNSMQNKASQSEDEMSRRERLSETSEKTGISVDSLDRIDRGGQKLALALQREKEQNVENIIDEIAGDDVPQMGMLIPVINMLSSNPQLIQNMGKLPGKFPESSAKLIYHLHKIFEHENVYQHLGIEQKTVLEIYAEMGFNEDG